MDSSCRDKIKADAVTGGCPFDQFFPASAFATETDGAKPAIVLDEEPLKGNGEEPAGETVEDVSD